MASERGLPEHHIALLVQQLEDPGALGTGSSFDAFVATIATWAGEEVAAGGPWAVWIDVFPADDPGRTESLFLHAGGDVRDSGVLNDAREFFQETDLWGVSSFPEGLGTGGGQRSPVSLVSAAWPAGEKRPRLAVRLVIPIVLRNEPGTIFQGLISEALQYVSARLSKETSEMIIKERYSKSAFEQGVHQVANNARDALLLDPELFTRGLETLSLHLDSYVRETFGDAADEAFLRRLRQSAGVFRSAEDASDDGLKNRFPMVHRTLQVWADLLHIRSLLIVPREGDGLPPDWMKTVIPTPLGGLLPDVSMPWRDLLGELLLLHWIGSFEAARMAFAHPWLHERLTELGWWGGKMPDEKARPEFATTVMRALAGGVVGRFPQGGRGENTVSTVPEAAGALRFWEDSKVPEPGSWEELSFLLGRWMMLQQMVELRLTRVDHRALKEEGSILRQTLDLLWERTEGFCLQWLLYHRQWSGPSGLDREGCTKRRRQASRWLDGNPEEQPESGLVLHVDSVWTNLYLLHRMFRHFRPRAGSAATSWEGLEREFPTESAVKTFLRHLCRVTVFVIWQILKQERHPERFLLIPGENGREDDEAEAPAAQAEPFHQPVGAERYARSLVYLMDVFGHAVLHVEREVDIAGYLERVIDSELLLHAVSDYYRDHLYHLVDMCLLGDFLLTARQSRRRGHLFRLLVPPPEGGSDPHSSAGYQLDEVRRQWFVGGVFHDVGYLFSLLARLPAMLREHEPAEHHRGLINSLERVLRGEVRVLERRISDLTEYLSASTVGLDRGVHSAVILRDHLLRANRNGEGDGGDLVNRYLPSLRAICQHSLMSENIFQDRDPLSYLMVLCDELQDWGRNRVRARELRRYTVFRTAQETNWQERRIPIVTELFFPVEGLEGDDFVLTLDQASTGRGAQPSPTGAGLTLKIVQAYGQDEVGYLNPVYLWILRAQNLQRLVPGSKQRKPLGVEIVTVTGVPQRLRKLNTTFSALLQEMSVRFPRLRLGDLGSHLQAMFRQKMTQVENKGRECPGEPPLDLAFACRIEQEMGRDDRSVEMQVFRLGELSSTVPLPGFSREGDLGEVATRYVQVLGEHEEQRRLRGLHPLWSGRIEGME